MKVGILHGPGTGRDKFRFLLQNMDAGMTFQVHEIGRGDFPASSHDCDAFIISGSTAGVYDDEAWISDLSSFIQTCERERRKLVGICFGHQMIAHALGGLAEKSEKGWGLGRSEFRVLNHKAWMEPSLDRCTLYYTHQDQITRLPSEAELLGTSDFCPVNLFSIGNRILGMQGHPEYSREHMVKVILKLKDQIPPKTYHDALDSLDKGPSDSDPVTQWIIQFIYL